MKRAELIAGLGLFCATALVFSGALRGEFLTVDDGTMVWRNPNVAAGLGWDGLTWAFTTLHFGWHPLTWLSHQLDATLFGPNPMGHHATSVLLHALASAFAFAALQRATGRLGPSLAAAALFALHPMRAESVAWVADRKDVLCALFWCAALWAHVEYRAKESWPRWALVVALGLCAQLSKGMALSLPLTLLAVDVWPLRPGDWRKRLWEKTPLVLGAAVAAVQAVRSQAFLGALQEDLPVAARLAQVPVVYAQNLGRTLWPANLGFQYMRYTPGAGEVAASVALLAALLAGAWSLRRTRPGLLWGLLWFLGVLLPTTGVSQFGAQMTADRFTLLPHLGLFAGLALSVPPLEGRAARLLRVGTAALLLALASQTLLQLSTWRTTETVAERALEVNPENWWAHLTLGNVRLAEGRPGDALPHFHAALKVAPDDAYTRAGLGAALAESGNVEAGLAMTREAFARDRKDVNIVRYHLRVLKLAGRADLTLEALRQLRADPPADIPVEAMLGTALAESGRLAEAVEPLQAAVRRGSRDPGAWLNLARVLHELGRRDEAQRTLAEARARFPGDPVVERAAASLQAP